VEQLCKHISLNASNLEALGLNSDQFYEQLQGIAKQEFNLEKYASSTAGANFIMEDDQVKSESTANSIQVSALMSSH